MSLFGIQCNSIDNNEVIWFLLYKYQIMDIYIKM